MLNKSHTVIKIAPIKNNTAITKYTTDFNQYFFTSENNKKVPKDAPIIAKTEKIPIKLNLIFKLKIYWIVLANLANNSIIREV
mmetsp:Transcript_8810/g.7786  ORF Transcript_8810/g.7786 Transcript_8810/m.7786 type:complete len:83 (+) Transcript_8810:54-302(+)